MKGPMPETTLILVAKLTGVAPTSVTRVVNGSENVAEATREKILAIIRDLDCAPNIDAANLRRKRLNDENTRGSKGRLVYANEYLRAGCNSYLNVPCPTKGAFIFSPEEGRALAQQFIRLRRDLDKIKETHGTHSNLRGHYSRSLFSTTLFVHCALTPPRVFVRIQRQVPTYYEIADGD
jgi:Bacterial regulatory proteins, lacI family